MLTDFLIFLRHVFALLHFVRGVLVMLLFILAVCVFVLMSTENISLGDAIYLTAITGLSVGYGDIVPTTPFGRITAVVVGIVGFICIGIVVAVVTHALAQAVEEKRRL
jgi:voltage-gated potassium channel